jgi:hypothetical protein
MADYDPLAGLGDISGGVRRLAPPQIGALANPTGEASGVGGLSEPALREVLAGMLAGKNLGREFLANEEGALKAFGVKPKPIDTSSWERWKSESGLFQPPEGTPDVPQFNLARYNPARGTPKDIEELVSSPEIRDVLAQFIARGQQLGGQYWYNAQQLADRWRGAHGPEEGTRLFNQNIDLTGATSAQSDVPTNIRNASWYQQRAMQGLPPQPADVPNPNPYGHFAQKTHKPIVARMLEPGAEWNPVSHDKMAGYTSGLKGNETPVAVDLHATRLPAMISGDPRFLLNSFKADKTAEPISPRQLVESGKVSMDEALKNPVWWLDQPTKAAYPAMERMWQEVGHDLGMTPAQAHASGWVGGGSTTGSKAYNEANEAAKQMSTPFIGVYDSVLMRTARQLGMDPEDVLKAVMSGKIALR